MSAPSTRRRSGFTLIELLAVVFLMTLVLSVAVDFYLDLSRASNDAAAQTRESRRAVSLLDRVARDLEGAVLLVKPEATDPLAHPWLFLAESHQGELGADRIKFLTRSHRPRSSQARQADLTQVAYVLHRDESDEFELLRWSLPRLPEGLDRSFPREGSEGTLVLATGLRDFGIRLLGEGGEWTDRWDSSTLVDSSELPLAAEISVEIAGGDDADPEAAPGRYSRRVLLPLRPLDLDALLHPGEEQPPNDLCESGDTVRTCLERAENERLLRDLEFGPNELAIFDQFADQCFTDVKAQLPLSDLVDQLVGCE